MQHQLTDDELRAEYIRVMGPELGELYYELDADFSWLRHKWSEFHELFDKGPERIELLNTVASNFFYFLQKLLFEDAMMHLCRLTDPSKSAGHETLTVMRLAGQIHDPSLKASIENQAAPTKTRCEFARKWRKKKLAHTDLVTLRNGPVSTLPSVNSEHIDDALKFIRDLLNSVANYYSLPPSASVVDPWGSKSLVYYLEKAVRMEADMFGISRN